jgi:hypothetical protein
LAGAAAASPDFNDFVVQLKFSNQKYFNHLVLSLSLLLPFLSSSSFLLILSFFQHSTLLSSSYVFSTKSS